MDEPEPRPLRPQQVAISERSDHDEWALVEPIIPPAKRGGRRRQVNVREVLNAIFCALSTGCQWQALPKDLPPKSTAHCYFDNDDVAAPPGEGSPSIEVASR